MPLTHYKAPWVNWDASWPEPIWPLKKNDGKYVVHATIARELINPWKEFEAKGVGSWSESLACSTMRPTASHFRG
jgi:hypothetical protein